MALVWWSDLPDDLLNVVYVKVTGLLHRVCFAAVCRSWRAAAIRSRHMAPPALLLLVFSSSHNDGCKTNNLYCPEDGHVLRIPLPTEAIDKCFVGAYDGGWVAALGHDMHLLVVNLFSHVEVSLPAKDLSTVYSGGRDYVIQKVVFSESPTSSGCILATTTPKCGIALCRIGCPSNEWTTEQFDEPLVDIAFSNGQLYGLTFLEDLIKFEIGMNKDGEPMVTREPRRLSIQMRSADFIMSMNNIIELHVKLAMVVRNWQSGDTFGEPLCQVFQLTEELPTKYTYKWEEVMSLGDNALFLGKMWSKVVYVEEAGRGGVQRSCICTDDLVCSTRLDGHGGNIFSMLFESFDDIMQKVKPVGYNVVARPSASTTGMWVLPPDF